MILAKRAIHGRSDITLGLIKDYDFGLLEKAKENNETYKLGECILSERKNSVVNKGKVWISPHHLELFKELLNQGCELEILDDAGNTVRKISSDGK